MTAIEFEGVWKRYLGASRRDAAWQAVQMMLRRNNDGADLFWALKDVSFTLEPGEALGIIGPNGAGKTTILKLLSRITIPTRGLIHTQGRIGALINLGAGFHPELTGRENIYLNGVILGMSRREVARKFDAIVEFSGLQDYLDMPVKRYSSGMYARLGFSVAVHIDPEILLIDEVLAVGDFRFREKCYRRMWELTDERRCVVFVSHNLFAVKSVCSRAIFLNEGRVICDGTPDDAIRAYESWAFGQREPAEAAAAAESGSLDDARPRIEFKAVELLNGNGDSTLQFNPTDVFTVKIRYEALRLCEPIVFSVGAIRLDGLHCFTVFSDEESGALVTESGTGTVEARFPDLALLPGRYQIYVSAYLATAASRIGRVACQSSVFHIDVQGPEHFGVHHGVFHNPATWHVRPSSGGTLRLEER